MSRLNMDLNVQFFMVLLQNKSFYKDVNEDYYFETF